MDGTETTLEDQTTRDGMADDGFILMGTSGSRFQMVIIFDRHTATHLSTSLSQKKY